jgi:hypothetical protein
VLTVRASRRSRCAGRGAWHKRSIHHAIAGGSLPRRAPSPRLRVEPIRQSNIGFRAFCGRGRSQGALDVRHCSPMGEGRSTGRRPLHMGQTGRRSSPVRTLSHRPRSTHRVSNRFSFRSFKTPARTAYLYTSGSRGVDRSSEPSLATRRIDAGNLHDALWFAGRYGPADIRSTEPTPRRHRRRAGAPHSPTLKVPADSARSPTLDHDPGAKSISSLCGRVEDHSPRRPSVQAFTTSGRPSSADA